MEGGITEGLPPFSELRIPPPLLCQRESMFVCVRMFVIECALVPCVRFTSTGRHSLWEGANCTSVPSLERMLGFDTLVQRTSTPSG